MEPITTTIAIITAVTAAVATRQYVKLRNKNEEIDSLLRALNQYSSSYAFEKCDMPMINECSKYLHKYLGNSSLAEKLEGLTREEQKRIIENFVSELAKRMKVRLSSINIQPLGGGTLGAEIVDNDGNIQLYLNEDLIDADPDRLVFIMLHELRHAVQDSALRNDVWGFSDERKAQWLIGNQQYVCADSEAKFRAYYFQILENDANAFAKAVLEVSSK